MRKVRLGVVGCGVIAQWHLNAAKAASTTQIAAVADLNEAAAHAAAEKFGVKAVYTNADGLIDDDSVEAIVFATPTAGRAALGLKALKKGKHILLEKPGGMNAAEVEELIAAKGKLVAGCCSSRFRFTPPAEKLTEFIAQGNLGDIVMVYSRVHDAAGPRPERMSPPWRLNRAVNGGGVLVNLGCYDLDYLLGITGFRLKPRTVLAKTWGISPPFVDHVVPGSDAETFYTALIICEGGAVISIERSEYATAHTEGAWQIVGARGTLCPVMIGAGSHKILFDEADSVRGTTQKTIWQGTSGGMERINAGPVTDLANAILTGAEPRTSLEKYLVIQKIFDAIYRSSETGKAVDVR